MLKRFLDWFSSPSSELEQFILSKNPKSAADIEYWTIRYGHESTRGFWQ